VTASNQGLKLKPGDTIGNSRRRDQLGRMLAMAAARLGLRLARWFSRPDPDSPALSMVVLNATLRGICRCRRRWNCSPNDVDTHHLRIRECAVRPTRD